MSEFWDTIKQDWEIYLGIIFIFLLIIGMIIIGSYNPKEEEKKPFEIHQKVCFMPRDCFDTEQEFADQFPEKEVPEYYPECLIYCTKNNINSELFPIG